NAGRQDAGCYTLPLLPAPDAPGEWEGVTAGEGAKWTGPSAIVGTAFVDATLTVLRLHTTSARALPVRLLRYGAIALLETLDKPAIVGVLPKHVSIVGVLPKHLEVPLGTRLWSIS
ncbi:hypothetical protein KIPB_012164, partial [Kipferlia bialata]